MGFYNQKKRAKIRQYLRKKGFLPKYGEDLNEEQRIINEQITNDDFSFYDKVKINKAKRDDTKDYDLKTLLIKRIKKSAKERGIYFDLSINDLDIPEYCPLLGLKLTFEYAYDTKDSYYTVDRIDSSMGYVKDNIQILSYKANTMKNNATYDELMTFAKNILENYQS
jgi:hypothetical protein